MEVMEGTQEHLVQDYTGNSGRRGNTQAEAYQRVSPPVVGEELI